MVYPRHYISFIWALLRGGLKLMVHVIGSFMPSDLDYADASFIHSMESRGITYTKRYLIIKHVRSEPLIKTKPRFSTAR